MKKELKGINEMPAKYYWFSLNGKKDKLRGIQFEEIWYAKVLPHLDGEEELIEASIIEIITYNTFIKQFNSWKKLDRSGKIEIIGIVLLVLEFILVVLPCLKN